MTEDKNGVKNGEANTEMAPQEDGTKVPLTDNECPEVRARKMAFSGSRSSWRGYIDLSLGLGKN